MNAQAYMGAQFGSGIFNAGMGFANTALGAHFSKKAADKAWARQQTMMQNQIQWRVEDMKKAGLNPVLAVRGGFGGGGGSAPIARPGIGPQGNMSMKGSEAFRLMSQQRQLMHSQQKAADAQAVSALATARHQGSQADRTRILAGLDALEFGIRSDPEVLDSMKREILRGGSTGIVRDIGPLLPFALGFGAGRGGPRPRGPGRWTRRGVNYQKLMSGVRRGPPGGLYVPDFFPRGEKPWWDRR